MTIHEHEELMRKKAISKFNQGVQVHITFKVRGWERGWISKEPGEFSLILEFNEEGRRKNGANSKEFFFMEMEEIDEKAEEGK